MTQNYVGTKIVMAWQAAKDDQPGYAVKYEDGYTSWSPQAAFEQAYLPIGHTSHLPQWHQRVIGEHAQLQDAMTKLGAFINKIDSGENELQLDIEQFNLLKAQHVAMGEVVNILAARLALLPK